MLQDLLLTASLIVSFAAYPAYAYAISRQGTRPTRPTWIMIFVLDVLLFLFALRAGQTDWLLLGFTAGNLMMLALMAIADVRARTVPVIGAANTAPLPPLGQAECLRLVVLGRDPWTRKDIAFVVVAVGAVLLYKLTNDPVIAIWFSLLSKIAASVPMWFNLWKDPHREAMLPWAIWLVGGLLYLASIPEAQWNFVKLATPILFVILEGAVLLLLARRFTRSRPAIEMPPQKLAA